MQRKFYPADLYAQAELFRDRFLPTTGDLLAVVEAEFEGKPYFANALIPRDQFAAGITTVASVARPRGRSSYTAAASYIPGRIVGNKGRKKLNVHALAAWWLDVDVGKYDSDGSLSANSYADRRQAFLAVIVTCLKQRIPLPDVIRSGNGLHFWWAAGRDMTPEEWHPTALRLAQWARINQIRSDMQITPNEACVMRAPGSYHAKSDRTTAFYGPGEQALSLADTLNPYLTPGMTLADALTHIELPERTTAMDTRHAMIADLEPEVMRIVASAKSVARPSHDPENLPSALLVQQHCKQIAQMHLATEPERFPMLCVAAHCAPVGGLEAAHVWMRDAEYDSTRMDNKLTYIRDGGYLPGTCAKINDNSPGVCNGCKFAGQIRSPIALGRVSKLGELGVTVQRDPLTEGLDAATLALVTSVTCITAPGLPPLSPSPAADVADPAMAAAQDAAATPPATVEATPTGAPAQAIGDNSALRAAFQDGATVGHARTFIGERVFDGEHSGWSMHNPSHQYPGASDNKPFAFRRSPYGIQRFVDTARPWNERHTPGIKPPKDHVEAWAWETVIPDFDLTIESRGTTANAAGKMTYTTTYAYRGLAQHGKYAVETLDADCLIGGTAFSDRSKYFGLSEVSDNTTPIWRPLLKAITEQYSRDHELSQDSGRLGWQDNGSFHLGYGYIDPTGVYKSAPLIASAKAHALVQHMRFAADETDDEQASRDAWIGAFKTFMARTKPELQIGALVSLASPLVRLSGSSDAIALINLVGGTGVGKTTATRIGQSVWGAHDGLMGSGSDSPVARVLRCAAMHSLPNYIDEFQNVTKSTDGKPVATDTIRNYIMSLANRKDRARGTQNAGLKSGESWECLTAITSNSTIMNLVLEDTAVTARVLELDCGYAQGTAAEGLEFQDITRVLYNNHSVFGKAYARMLVRNRESITAALRTAMADVAEGHSQADRSTILTAGCIVTAARIIHNLGIIDAAQVERITARLKKAIADTSNHRAATSERVGDEIDGWILKNIGKLGVYAGAAAGSPGGDTLTRLESFSSSAGSVLGALVIDNKAGTAELRLTAAGMAALEHDLAITAKSINDRAAKLGLRYLERVTCKVRTSGAVKSYVFGVPPEIAGGIERERERE